MRMRKKPNLEKRMAECEKYICSSPEQMKGSWGENLRAELGCGKGSFTVKTAMAEPDANIVAIERVESALVMAAEKARDAGLENIRFISGDVKKLPEYFEDGKLKVIYVNFCDPWPKSRDAKFRLTAPNFLRMYASLLENGGELRFRTDNLPLFEWSAGQIQSEGWDIVLLTNDADNEIKTDYEEKFFNEGVQINMLCARKTDKTKTINDGEVPRLRNSALSDARGY